METEIVKVTTKDSEVTATVHFGCMAVISILLSLVGIGVCVAVGLQVINEKSWKIPLLFGGMGIILALSAVVCKIFDTGTHLAEKMMDMLVEYKKTKN